jgi:hypothetical protein
VNEEWFKVWGCWCQLFTTKGKVALCYLVSKDVYGDKFFFMGIGKVVCLLFSMGVGYGACVFTILKEL